MTGPIKIKNSFALKALTLLLLISVLIQSFIFVNHDQPQLICIGSGGHVAIENQNECSASDSHIGRANIQANSLSHFAEINNFAEINSNHCYDIYLSLVDAFANNQQNINLKYFQPTAIHTNNSLSNLIRPFKALNTFQPLHKILIEYSTVSLLL